jgi:iron uptake system EfeUOB component EfeO/EfeM
VWDTSPVRRASLTGAILILLCVLLPAGARAATAQQRSCTSYPTPGTLAPAGTALPGWLTARYSVLESPHRAVDRVPAAQVGATLTAAGLVLAHSRFLGRAALGGRVYLIPAEHLLSFKLAPARCLPVADRSLEHELAPQLKREYTHWALCIVVLHSASASPSCGAAGADPEALLYAAGTPGFGIVPDHVPAVTLHYLTAPARTVPVRHNFYLLDEPAQPVAPCALEWENASANVIKTFAGCNYAQLLAPALDEYRTYVKQTLSTLSTQVASLIGATQSGDLATAEAAWLPAHETWLDIGQDDGAYSAYGALGSELDGTAAGVPQGISGAGFTGFHRVELDLWTDHDLSAATADAEQLQTILNMIIATPLNQAFPATNNGIANWVLRPHETLEDAIRDTLTGDDDYGSGTGVATIVADVTATREFLTLMGPTLAPLDPRLIPRAEAELTALDHACDATQINGQWVGISALSERQREQIDADAGAAAETLSAVPDTLTNVGNAAASE